MRYIPEILQIFMTVKWKSHFLKVQSDNTKFTNFTQLKVSSIKSTIFISVHIYCVKLFKRNFFFNLPVTNAAAESVIWWLNNYIVPVAWRNSLSCEKRRLFLTASPCVFNMEKFCFTQKKIFEFNTIVLSCNWDKLCFIQRKSIPIQQDFSV